MSDSEAYFVSFVCKWLYYEQVIHIFTSSVTGLALEFNFVKTASTQELQDFGF